MPRTKRLTEFKKGQTVALSSSGLNSQTIAKKMGRFKTIVENFFNLNDNYGRSESGGRPKSLSSREERTALRIASKEK